MSYREIKDFEYAPMKLNIEEIEDPQKVIESFFDHCSLKMYRKYISSVLKSAYADSHWTKDVPAALLRLHEHIERLIEAAFIINFNPTNIKFNESLIVNENVLTEEIIEPSLYVGRNANSSNWDFFPRYLSEKEFLNPCRVFKKFFAYKNLPAWREQVYKLIYYALISDGTDTAGVEIDYLTVYILLQKLIEASHLILVREINKTRK